jgi:hypothetical protein|tara:strand:+ start:692 stop:868 length:177 start_codon:yes stop_codon:yes gene_type:complete
MKKKTRNIKSSKHSKIINDYDKIKSNHLEKLTNKILKDDEKNQRLKSKTIDKKFLDLF